MTKEEKKRMFKYIINFLAVGLITLISLCFVWLADWIAEGGKL